MSSDPKVEEIRARLAAATPGPWDKDRPMGGRPFEKVIVRNLGGGSQRSYVAQCGSPEDWEFIANAPADIDYLLTKLDEAEKELDLVDRQHSGTVGRYSEARRRAIAAEERERVLIDGVKEALVQLGEVSRIGNAVRILSRLLPSTPTEEGKTDE